MIRWLWKIIVGAKPEQPAPPCARDCHWSVMDHGKIKNGLGDICGEWYTLRCDVCGLLKNHENSQ